MCSWGCVSAHTVSSAGPWSAVCAGCPAQSRGEPLTVVVLIIEDEAAGQWAGRRTESAWYSFLSGASSARLLPLPTHDASDGLREGLLVNRTGVQTPQKDDRY